MPSLRRPSGQPTGKPFNCKGVVLSDGHSPSTDFPHTSLAPKPPPTVTNLKRKRWKFLRCYPLPPNLPCHSPDLTISLESTSPTKKYKKTLAGKHASGKESWDLQDQAALNRRAERFKREHQLERQKWVGNGQSSFHHNNANTHQDVFSSTSSSGNWDEPENTIVTFLEPFRGRHLFEIADHATQDCWNLSRVVQGLPSTHLSGFWSPRIVIVYVHPRHRNLIQRKSGRILCYAKPLTN